MKITKIKTKMGEPRLPISTELDAVVERMKDDPQKDTLTLIDIARAGGASEAMVDHIREIQLIKAALA